MQLLSLAFDSHARRAAFSFSKPKNNLTIYGMGLFHRCLLRNDGIPDQRFFVSGFVTFVEVDAGVQTRIARPVFCTSPCLVLVHEPNALMIRILAAIVAVWFNGV